MVHTTHSTTNNRQLRSVGVFPSRHAAEQALHELRDSGFPMDRVSAIAKDAVHEGDLAGTEVRDHGNLADEGTKVGAVSGGALGGLTGLLVGLGALAIPGIGPVMLAGAVGTALATTLAGGAIGAVTGGLLGGLIGLGIPEDRAKVYSDRVARGDYLIIVEGTDTEIARAEAILHHRGIEEYGVYDVPHQATSSSAVSSVPAAGLHDRSVATTHSSTSSPVATTTPSVRERRRAVGVFSSHRDAEAALTELRDSGFSMNHVSIIAKDTEHRDNLAGAAMSTPDKTKADEGAKAGAITGGALGSLGGLLVGLGALAIPGVGPVVLGGAAATALATTISGGAIGAAAGGLVGGLVGLGIPEERAKHYNQRFQRGDYLVVVDGSESDLRRTETILTRRGMQDWGVFDASDTGAYQPETISGRTTQPSTTTSTTTSTGQPQVTIIDHRDNAPL